MLASRYKPLIERFFQPLARVIARTVSPSVITLAVPLLAFVLSLWLVRTQQILPFCIALTGVGCLDGLDGAVARASGRVSRFGAYLDAVCDRYVETIVVCAVAYVTDTWFLSLLNLSGAYLFSYAKARAAMEVAVSNTEWPDLMERTERGILFMGGLAARELIAWRIAGRDLFWWTLVLLACLTHLSVVQRILRARRFIQQRSAVL